MLHIESELPLPHFHRLMHTVISRSFCLRHPLRIMFENSQQQFLYFSSYNFLDPRERQRERKAMPVVAAIVVVAVTYCPAWLHLLFHHHFCFVLFLVLFFFLFSFLPHLVAHLKRFSTWATSFSLVTLKRRFNSHFTWRVGTVGSSAMPAMPTMPRCARWLPGHKWQSKLLAAVNRQIREREKEPIASGNCCLTPNRN